MTTHVAMMLVGVPVAVVGLAGCGGGSHASSSDAGRDGGAGVGDAFVSDDGSSGASSGASSGSSGASSGASSGGSSGGTSSGARDGSANGDGGANADAGGAYNPSVYQHHKNGTRDGVYIDPVLTSGTGGKAATMHLLGYMGTVTTNVYAQPLYVESGLTAPAFIVATENNHVTALNAGTGVVLWDQGPSTYAQPVTGGLPCGNVLPLGIMGTPFIDPASPINAGQGVIYFAAMTSNGGTPTHKVYAVKLSDGTVLPNWPVDVSAKVTNFVSACQNQRGALQYVNGVLYVPYGGLDGDCYSNGKAYYGWVIGFPANNPQQPLAWHTVAPKGGIWGPGSLPTDGTSVFPITGNTSVAGTTWGGGEAIIRLAATPAGPTFSNNAPDYYAPTNWQAMDSADADLGGANEVIFDMPGASKPHLIAAGGKDRNFYLVDRDNLGGIGGELLKQTVATNELKGAPAVYRTKMGTYVAFHVEGGGGVGCPGTPAPTGNLVAVKVTAGATGFTATVAWCSADSGLASPMVTTTDGTSNAIVWDASNHLWGYDGDTGAKLFTGNATQMGTAIQGWNTPIAIGNGRIGIAVDGALYVFGAP